MKRTLPALALAALVLFPAAAGAHPRDPGYSPHGGRDSWYIGFGFGPAGGSYELDGERVNFRDHHGTSPTQFGMQLELGATLNPRFLLGGEVSILVSSASSGGYDSTLSVGRLLAVATWFPMERGLFFRGGAGFAGIQSTVDDGFFREESDVNGVGLLGGVGYGFWLGRRFNLTLHADVNHDVYSGGDGLPDSATTMAGYLGFRWY